MRTDRIRYDPFTRELVSFEQKLHTAFTKENGWWGGTAEAAQQLGSRLEQIDSVRTTLELDFLFQLSMMYLSVLCTLSLGEGRPRPPVVKVACGWHPEEGQPLLVKPCSFFPAQCSFRHPAVSPVLDGEMGVRNIGFTGLSMCHGRVIACAQNPTGGDGCPRHVPFERFTTRSRAALPLVEAEAEPGEAGAPPCCCTELEEFGGKSWHDFKPKSPTALCLESDADFLSPEFVAGFLALPEVRGAMDHLHRHLERYRRERPLYKILSTATSLFELSQHTLQGRRALRTLLREISELCDGADVTLHLKDMFLENVQDILPRELVEADDVDKAYIQWVRPRAIRLVAGVGPRVRSFLVNDRVGSGLVGEVIESGTGQTRFLDEAQIREQIESEHQALEAGEPVNRHYPYRQLMEGTRFNMVVPIRFHVRTIGAINVEWAEDPPSSDEQRASLQALLERMASYFSLIIDFFDDGRNPRLNPQRQPGVTSATRLELRTSRSFHRRALAYYADEAIRAIDETADDKSLTFLQSIIDGIGYPLTPEPDLRVIASLRRLEGSGETAKLETPKKECTHGFGTAGPGDDDGPSKDPIPLAGPNLSVLGHCARYGIPVFGHVEKDEHLQPDELCRELVPRECRPLLARPIRYIPAGTSAVYEVGVPLIFGHQILGTFDFELFRTAGRHSQSEKVRFSGDRLLHFLEWGRMISFCMAYQEDRSLPVIAALNDQQRRSFEQFRRICLQIVANVPLDQKVLIPIVEEYAKTLLPVHVSVRHRKEEEKLVGEGVEESGDDGAHGSTEAEIASPRSNSMPWELWLRGTYLGELLLEPAPRADEQLFSDDGLDTGTGLLMGRLLSRFFASSLAVEAPQEGHRGDFERRIGLVWPEPGGPRIAGHPGRPGPGPGRLGGDLLDQVHEVVTSLFRHAASPNSKLGSPPTTPSSKLASPPPSPYGWFLLTARTRDDDPSRSEFRSIRGSSRWVSMNTREMSGLVTEVLRQPETAWRERLEQKLGDHEQSERKERIESWLRENGKATPPEEGELVDLLTELLAMRNYPHPSGLMADEQKPSITLLIARLEQTQSFHDLNRSPYRSPRISRWFFGDESYTLIGAPIRFGGECVGILQFFRRRDRFDDLDFFKGDEVREVERLQEFVQQRLEEELKLVPLSQAADGPRTIKRSEEEVGERLQAELKKGKKVAALRCGFLHDGEFVRNTFAKEYVPAACQVVDMEMLSGRWTPDKGKTVLVVARHDVVREKAREVKEVLERVVRAHVLVVLYPAGTSEEEWDALKAVLPDVTFKYAQREIPEELEELTGQLLAQVSPAHLYTPRLLCRSSDAWSFQSLVEACGDDSRAIRRNVAEQMEAMEGEPRILPHWITFARKRRGEAPAEPSTQIEPSP